MALRRGFVAALGLLAIGGCGGGSNSPTPETPPPPPPATISLSVPGVTTVQEADNPKVQVNLQLDAPVSGAVSVDLVFAGTATRGVDYAVNADEVALSAGSRSATMEIDLYRDFDEEGNETVEVSLGTVTGNARAVADASSVTLTVEDGETATVNKSATPDDGEPPSGFVVDLLPFGFDVTDDAVVLTVAAMVPPDLPESIPLVAEWSTDSEFNADVHAIDGCYGPSADPLAAEDTLTGIACEIVSSDDPLDVFLTNIRVFRLPLAMLEPNRRYYLRAWLISPPEPFEFGVEYSNVVFHAFATNASGRVAVRCKAPERMPAGSGDPLFAQQWHLQNTGQTAFSDRGGTAGADLRMSSAIDLGRDGAGVKLAVVDSGLEICHPDLAANTAGGGSFNFGHEGRPGVSRSDPFNFSILGDHGTSVAGIAAAAANNGFGGRGVAPGVTLVGFNPLEATGGEDMDPDTAAEVALIQSLGGSDRDPDSASVDVFNLSFGYEAPSENVREELERVLREGVSQLRSGRGALYVKAAGNTFDACDATHPFNRELGCIGANADPDQNTPWLIAVGGFNADDVKSSYSSAGANLWVVGPSGEDGNEAPAMITTDQVGTLAGYSEFPENRLTSDNPLNRDGDYISAFGGTSSAAPAVAGAVAILLGVNPELTWRDVKHILASTARRIDPDIAEVRAAFNGTPYIAQQGWQTNAAGFDFHNWYGFGAVDVDAAVQMVQSHAPGSLGSFVESEWFDRAAAAEPVAIPDADGTGVSDTRDIAGLPDGARIEAVVLAISVEHGNALDLGVTLRSPEGTVSVVNAPLNSLLDGFPGLTNWNLLSNAFYGENPNGTWTLHVADIAAEDSGSLTGWRLRFYYGERGAN